MKIVLTALTLAAGAAMTVACGGNTSSSTATAREATPSAQAKEIAFDADTAYAYVRQQVEFGPRVPGTPAHEACERWLTAKLRGFGADTVIEQRTTVTAANGDRLPVNNILARFNTEASRRILIAAHYDTRPWADRDADEARRNEPFDGANDGGSGVAVALEIARQCATVHPEAGVDILLVDAEDYGISGDGEVDTEDSWCLGTQYFIAHQPFTPADRPEFGILLDMVGGTDAKFYREYFSEIHAKSVNDRIFSEAARLGLGDIFVDGAVGGAVTDDHTYLIAGGIPTADIIECAHPATGSFNPRWHTHADNLDGIDRATLDAVGRTVMGVILRP